MQPYDVTYPETIDNSSVLVDVKDSLVLKLAVDYNVGDKFIYPTATLAELQNWPPRGFLTLTDNRCPDELRAVSFYYTYIDTTRVAFAGLIVLPSTTDTYKPAIYTTISLNVIAEHHNILKNALINIENFLGIYTEQASIYTGDKNSTITERINKILQVAYTPVAWFEVSKNVLNIPNSVIFKNLSQNMGTNLIDNEIVLEWDFGDNTSSTLTYLDVKDVVPPDATNIIAVQKYPNINTIIKTYNSPGKFDVTLTVKNKYGSNSITLPSIVNARIQAPLPAEICVAGLQAKGAATPLVLGDVYRVPTNTQILVSVPIGNRPTTTPAPGDPPSPIYTYAGELCTSSGTPIDPIVSWTWVLSDDNLHGNSQETYASYSTGGLYSIILRVDTKYNCYRITNVMPPDFPDCEPILNSDIAYECGLIPKNVYGIDAIETTNLFLWMYSDCTNLSVRAAEYGLISQTFKCPQTNSLLLNQDKSFLAGLPNYENQLYEFETNFAFAKKTGLRSGEGGDVLLAWASGKAVTDPDSSQVIRLKLYNAYQSRYESITSLPPRPWNWLGIQYNDTLYFMLGTNPPYYPSAGGTANTSDTNMNLTCYKISTDTYYTCQVFSPSSFFGAASELMQNPFLYNGTINEHGNFAKYRLAVHNNIGYFLRDTVAGSVVTTTGMEVQSYLRSFYCTVGTPTVFISAFRKLTDMSGPARPEGRLVNLNDGVYFFNNSANVTVYRPTTQVWSTGYAVSSTTSFRSLQDTNVTNFDDPKNTLIASSDNDHTAYITFSYSQSATMKFNNTTLAFSSMSARPSPVCPINPINPTQTGTQWNMGIF